jgi:hypothetical protein
MVGEVYKLAYRKLQGYWEAGGSCLTCRLTLMP